MVHPTIQGCPPAPSCVWGHRVVQPPSSSGPSCALSLRPCSSPARASTLFWSSLLISLLRAPGSVQFRGGPPPRAEKLGQGHRVRPRRMGLLGVRKLAGLGQAGANGQSPGGPVLLQGALGLPAVLSHLGPSPCGHCSGSGRLGSSLCAGRREGGGWQGPQPGMCVQECGCSGVGGRTREGWGGGSSNACRAERSGFFLPLEWVDGVFPESLPVATHFCLRPPPGEGAHGR